MKLFVNIMMVATVCIYVCGCAGRSLEEQLADQIETVGQPVRLTSSGDGTVVRMDDIPGTGINRLLVKVTTGQVLSAFATNANQGTSNMNLYMVGEVVEVVDIYYQPNESQGDRVLMVRKKK